jgi:hypothetical protein
MVTILFAFLLAGAIIWSLFWKGLALWIAAKKGNQGWFLALFVLNTLGILDIIYLFLIAKIGSEDKPVKASRRKKA